jgi:hypothetical protein
MGGIGHYLGYKFLKKVQPTREVTENDFFQKRVSLTLYSRGYESSPSLIVKDGKNALPLLQKPPVPNQSLESHGALFAARNKLLSPFFRCSRRLGC